MNEKIIFMFQPLSGEARINPSACLHPKEKIKPIYFLEKTGNGFRLMEHHQICIDCFFIDPIEHISTLTPTPVL